MAGKRSAVLAAWVAFLGCGCWRGNAPTDADRARSETSTQSATPNAPPTAHINAIIDEWSAGRHDEAVATLLRLMESPHDLASLRPYDMTEEQFIALPEAEREALGMEMAARCIVLRDVARELGRRAMDASAEGRSAVATTLLNAMKRLGAANRGPQVTRLVDLLGQALDKLADKHLDDLKRSSDSETKSSAPPTPPG